VRLVDGRPVFIEKRTGLKPSVQVWKPTDEADGQVKSHSTHIVHLWANMKHCPAPFDCLLDCRGCVMLAVKGVVNQRRVTVALL
jgi:hypothetical protein